MAYLMEFLSRQPQAYITAQIHEVRATFWSIGSLILIYLTCRVIWVAITT
jgi:glutathione S-transferase